jgi:hypothetical protein
MLRRYYGKISFLPIDQFKGHDGELVVDDITGKVYVMDGVTYGGTELVGATPRFGLTPPENPTDGALWYDPESGRIYIYYEQQWVDAAPNTTYSLPIAGEDVLGGIRVGNNLYIDEEGRLSAEDGNYVLPTATENDLGGVKVDNVSIVINDDGVISANTTSIQSNISLLFSNAATQSSNIATLFSNAATQSSNIATLFSNAATQALLINTVNANVAAANLALANKTLSSLTNNSHILSLGTDGNLTLPNGGAINFSNGHSILEGISAGLSDYVLPVADTNTLGGIKLGEGFTKDGSNKVTTNKLYSTNLTQPTQHYRLELDTNGVVHLPDQSIINGATLKSVAGNYAGITAGPIGKDEDSWVYVDSDGAWIGTKYNTNQKLWQFNNDGEIVFPDGNVQTTAYTGPVQTFVGSGAPVSPVEGTMWFDTTDGRTYIYLANVWVDSNPSSKGEKGDQGNQGIQGNVGPAGEQGPPSVYTGGNLIPNANVTYSIGNVDFQYKDLWVSNSTIYMGGVPLSIDNSGALTVNGNVVSGGTPAGLTGEIQLNINGAFGSDSTLRYVDNSGEMTLYADYLNAPGIFTNDISAGDGTPGNLTVTTHYGVATWTFSDTGSLKFPTNAQIGNISEFGPGLSTGFYDINGMSMGTAPGNDITITPSNGVGIYANSYQWIFDIDGSTTFPNGIEFDATNNNKFALNSTTINAIDLRDDKGAGFYTDNSGYVLRSNGTYNWTFDTSGKLTLPGQLKNNDTTNSISTSTGSFVTSGGLGVARDVHIGGTVNITDTTPSTSYDTGALTINGGLGVNGNINLSGNINILEGNINIVEFTGATGNFYGDPVTGFGAMYAGKSGFTALPYTVAQISTNSNSYSQVNIENINSGKLASADYIGTGDIGDDANWFFDIGIAGSGYDPVLAAENNAPGTSVGPLDAYYYVQGNNSVPETGGNLTIGTSQDSKAVKFIAGGTNAENVVLTLSQNNITAARNILAPNVYAGGYFYSNGTPIIAADGSFSITTINSTTVNAQTINTQVVNGNGASMTGMIYNPDIVNIRSNVTTLQGNVSYLQSEIDAANSAIVTANVGMKSYVDSRASTYSNVNVAAYLTGTVNVGNLITASGVFWSNGAAYSSGGSSSYSNADVASYLPTYAGNITAGNISVGNVTSNYRITLTNNAYIQSDTVIRNGSILLSPAATGTFPSVIIGGAGRIAAPNGSVHLILNASDITAQVALKSLIGTASTSLSTGAIQTSGGIGVGNDSYFAANVNIVGNLTVSGAKAISTPNLPAFRVYGTSGADILAGNTVTSTHGATVDYNQGNNYVNATGIFTAPLAGLYQAFATLRVGSNNGMNQASIQKNSSQSGGNVIAFWETDTNTGTAMHFSMTGIAKLAAGDTLRLQVLSGNVRLDTNDSWGVSFIG